MKVRTGKVGVSTGLLMACCLATAATLPESIPPEGISDESPPTTRFASTIQLALQEPNPRTMRQAQDMVVNQFDRRLQMLPQLRGAETSVQRFGNEVILSVTTNEDPQVPMRQLLMQMIQMLNEQRLMARGRSSFYRTSLSRPPQAEYAIKVHDPATETLFIDAQEAPLIDLLQDVRRQLPVFSYIIPRECAQQRVYWSFGDPDPRKHPPNLVLKAAMDGIAELLRVKVDNVKGAYVFSGNCHREIPRAAMEEPSQEWGWPTDILPMRWPSRPRPQMRAEHAMAQASMPEGLGGTMDAPPVRRRPVPLLQSKLPAQVYIPVTPIEFVR